MIEQIGFCAVSISPIRAEESDASEMVSQLLFGEIIEVIERKDKWLKIQSFADNYAGWIDPKHFMPLTKKELNRWMDGLSYEPSLIRSIQSPWGEMKIVRGSFIPYGNEMEFNIGPHTFQFNNSIQSIDKKDPFSLALTFLNSPYLWGGKTPFGIDCSGLTQQVFRFFDINLPRDAYQQAEYGTEVDFSDLECGDVAFFNNKEGKIIHVGIVGDDDKIIHASGHVRIDDLTEKGIIHSEKSYLTHSLCSIRRMY